MTMLENIKALTAQLYPSGRAFKGPANGWLRTLHDALAISEALAYKDALSLQDSILPDNPNFTADDATAWERRLGLITNTSVSLADRMAAIRRKMNHPGTVPARQHYLYVQGQLQAAGFNVYVYENRFASGGGYVTQNPITILGGGGTAAQHNDGQHNDFQHGGGYNHLVANSISRAADSTFNVGNNLRSTFFIAGPTLNSYAYVPQAREAEFRQLILKLKPAQTVAYLFIVYV